MRANCRSRVLAEESEPISQYVMAGSCCSVSATSFINDVPAENSEPTSMPASTMASVPFMRLARLMHHASATAPTPQTNALTVTPK